MFYRSAALAALLVACGGDDPPDPPRTTPLWSDGTHLRDAEGRIVLLRGVNARVEGVFDVTFDDGRTALEPIPPLTADDCRRMRALGLDHLRLPINWSGIEPDRDVFDEAYLARVDDALACAADAGLWVLVDLHQDAYSKEIGEDGAPLWAIEPAPEMLLEGPLDDLEQRRASAQVNAAFDTFFDPADPAGLQAEFIDMLAVVGARWAEHPAVLGFEIFNEPTVGQAEIDLFHFAAAARLREAAPDKLVFFEPSAIRNLFDFVPEADAPFPTTGAVYAPHVYTFIFGGNPEPLENLEPDDLEPSVEAARREAAAWETPLYFGEFGLGPDAPNADLWMGVQAELHDLHLAGDAFWVWKEESQARWGVFDHDAETDTWTERDQVVRWISRVHAARIAGAPVANVYDRTTGGLRLEIEPGTTGGLAHEIYIPERAADGFAMTCDGAALAGLARDPTTGLVAVSCEGALEVTTVPSLREARRPPAPGAAGQLATAR
jgi:endoglycosylceramidase